MLAIATRMNAPRGCEISSSNINLFINATKKEFAMSNVKTMNPTVSHNDAKVIKAAMPTKELLSPTAIAARLGLSPSYIYATIGKLELKPSGYQGKTHLYSEDCLSKFPVRQRHARTARVAHPRAIAHAPTLAQPAEGHTGNLMERISSLEKANEELLARLEQIASLVGA